MNRSGSQISGKADWQKNGFDGMSVLRSGSMPKSAELHDQDSRCAESASVEGVLEKLSVTLDEMDALGLKHAALKVAEAIEILNRRQL